VIEVKVGQRWRDRASRRRVVEVDDIDTDDGIALAHNVETQAVSVVALSRFNDELEYRGAQAVVKRAADFDLVSRP